MADELLCCWINKSLKYQFEDAALQEEKTPQEKLIELITNFVGD